ncbi:MAG: endonuclease [Chloroflexi bacterium]|nr:endonuclease [Chloroflexota bacterium]
MAGTVYVLHFSQPLAHARHYVGWTAGDAADRLQEHLHGRGSPLVRAAVAAGITVAIALSKHGTRIDERRWHNRHGAARICPICKGRKA